MKKILLAISILVATSSAMAQYGGHNVHAGHGHGHNVHAGHGHGGGYRGGWVGPAIIGGMIGYGLSRPYYDTIYAPPPVIYTQPQVVVQQPMVQTCTAWTETQHADGTITRTRTCQ
jgi:hypothetical protein